MHITNEKQEGLRYSCPVRSRLPRVCPPSGWTYKDRFLPADTIVSSSPHLHNYNNHVFTEPHKFNPDRWLTDDAAELKRLEQAYASFFKGLRACGGTNFTMAEIQLSLATLVRRFELEQQLSEGPKV